MGEEATNPLQTAPEQVASVQTDPAQAIPAAAPKPARKGGGLLVFLTVLLVLVGIADVILWSVAGYYFLLG